MPTITIENIPEKLYRKLEENAAKNRRSVSDEIVFCLEKVLESRPIKARRILKEIDFLRKDIQAPNLTEALLKKAKETGRL